MSILILFVILIALLIIGTPIGVALCLSTLAGVIADGTPIVFFTQKLYNTFDSFPLMAIPFFLLAGDIMQRGTLANSLLGMCSSLVGHLRGGLAHISILTALFYGALCGSAAATVAAVGGIMIPAMVKEGYPNSFSTAVNASAGGLGVLMPPSVPLILYGATAGVSITGLFIAGIIPGILVAIAFMITAAIIIHKHDYGIRHPKTSAKERIKAIWDAKYAILVPVIVLGCIYGGITTPTEAGCIAVVYALVIETFVTRSMTLKLFRDCLASSMRMLSSIFLVIIGATALGVFLGYHNVDRMLIVAVHTLTSDASVFMALMLILLLLLGTILDSSACILIMTPLLVPLVRSYGVDTIHFGIFMTVALCIGFLTPPVETNLFVACGISGLSIMQLSRAVLPFILAMLIVLLLITYIPQITLLLV